MLHIDELNEIFFNFSEVLDTEEAVSDTFAVVGYDSKVIIKLLGGLFYYHIFYPLVLNILKLLRYLVRLFPFCRLRRNRAAAYFDGQVRGMMWNGPIKFYD